MRTILFSMAFLLLSQTAHAARAVMENIKATNSTIMVNTSTERVGISTGIPQAKLDVVAGDSATILDGIRLYNASLSNGNGSRFDFHSQASTMVALEGWQQSSTQGRLDIKLFSGLTSTHTLAATFEPKKTTFGDGGVVVFATGTILLNGQAVSTSTAGGSSTAHVSSTTADISNSGLTETAFTVCQATQTVTIGSGCQAVMVYYSGAATRAGSGTLGCKMNFMEDGAYVLGNKDNGVQVFATASAGSPFNMGFQRIIRCPSAGSHSYCLSMAVYAASSCAYEAGITSAGNQFGVLELR